MHSDQHRRPQGPHLQIIHPTLRVAVGIIASAAIVSGLGFIFGPFSDLSAMQLAAGPGASAADGSVAAIVTANTGRAWGSAALQRQAAASAPAMKLAMREER